MLFAWNMYVMLTGYTHIEYRALMENSPIKNTMIPFPYALPAANENFARVFGTKNFIIGLLNIPINTIKIEENGSEWSAMLHWY